VNQKGFRLPLCKRIFLSGYSLNFDANFRELEKVTKKALLEIKQALTLGDRMLCLLQPFWLSSGKGLCFHLKRT
jgi:hypothetical protein